jgi:hypothetical protein
LAKKEGSRDNISVIVVYLKEPHLIATQSWPSQIQQTNNIMENMNMYEEQNVVANNPVTMDALGNTNQVCLSVLYFSAIHELRIALMFNCRNKLLNKRDRQEKFLKIFIARVYRFNFLSD